MKAQGEAGRVVVEMTYEEACDLGDVLAALTGPLYRFLGEPLRGFTTVLSTAAWHAAPVIREDNEDQDEG
ncbi:hypothetical protein ACIPQA_33695 [Streptomyces sp. NPDC090109]|uniref:hypothetical protein n=1 Tax=Streptomyces sp. NPDC090109 TaxID=3365948 RepID=UPI00380FDB5B